MTGDVLGLVTSEPLRECGGNAGDRDALLIVYIVRRGISYVPGYVRMCSSMSWYEKSTHEFVSDDSEPERVCGSMMMIV